MNHTQKLYNVQLTQLSELLAVLGCGDWVMTVQLKCLVETVHVIRVFE